MEVITLEDFTKYEYRVQPRPLPPWVLRVKVWGFVVAAWLILMCCWLSPTSRKVILICVSVGLSTCCQEEYVGGVSALHGVYGRLPTASLTHLFTAPRVEEAGMMPGNIATRSLWLLAKSMGIVAQGLPMHRMCAHPSSGRLSILSCLSSARPVRWRGEGYLVTSSRLHFQRRTLLQSIQ